MEVVADEFRCPGFSKVTHCWVVVVVVDNL